MINELVETWDDEEESPVPVVLSDETVQPLRALDRVDAHGRAPNLAGIVVMVLIVMVVFKKKIVRSTHLCLHTPQISGRNSFVRQSIESNVRIPMFQVIESTLLYYRPWPPAGQLARSHFLHFVSIDQGSVSAAQPSPRFERLQISSREGISLLGEGRTLTICKLCLDLAFWGRRTSHLVSGGHTREKPVD